MIDQVDAFEPDSHSVLAKIIEAHLREAPARHRLFESTRRLGASCKRRGTSSNQDRPPLHAAMIPNLSIVLSAPRLKLSRARRERSFTPRARLAGSQGIAPLPNCGVGSGKLCKREYQMLRSHLATDWQEWNESRAAWHPYKDSPATLQPYASDGVPTRSIGSAYPTPNTI